MVSLAYKKLNDGNEIPGIGFGTWQLASGSEAIDAASEALKVGYRLLDTARIYGNEKEVGDAVRKALVAREEIFVTTKLWPSDFGYDNALRAFDESLERLGLEYVDLYLIHWPRDNEYRRHESWRALEALKKQGKTKSIGVSNYHVEHLREALETSSEPPAVNQIEFHPYIFEEQRPILEFCHENNIVVEAYSPLSRGHGMDSLTVQDIAQRSGKTPAQIILRWAIQHDTVPIPKSSHPDRIVENFKVSDFELSQTDMEMLDELSR